jgi:hypothetical protein
VANPGQQESQQQAQLKESEAQFSAALAASPFADQQAFLAALLDEETRQRLERLKQTLESTLQQNQALALRAREALDSHRQQPPAETDISQPLEQVQEQLQQLTTAAGKQRPSGRDSPAAEAECRKPAASAVVTPADGTRCAGSGRLGMAECAYRLQRGR